MHGAPILVCGRLDLNLGGRGGGKTWPGLDTHIFELGLTTVTKVKRTSKNMTLVSFVFYSSQASSSRLIQHSYFLANNKVFNVFYNRVVCAFSSGNSSSRGSPT